MTFNVPQINLEGLKARVEALSRKAVKYGLAALVLSISEPKAARGKDEYGGERVSISYDVSVNVPEVKINGWSFLASIVHGEKGNVILKNPSLTGVNIPENFYNAAPVCEHCKINRYRKDSFLIINEAGEIKQIGRNCLADYIGHNVEGILRLAEIIREVKGMGDEYEETQGGGRHWNGWNLTFFVAYTILSIRLHGWISKSKAIETNTEFTTANNVMYLLEDNKEGQRPTEAEVKEAEIIVKWAEGINPNGNEYLTNLVNAVKMGYVIGQTAGIIASIVAAYRKAQEAELLKTSLSRENPSAYYGNIKDKVELNLTFVKDFSYDTQWGRSFIYIFIDEAGNKFAWKTSNPLFKEGEFTAVYEAGDKLTLKGTIKGHSEYKGEKQTILTRCKVLQGVTK